MHHSNIAESVLHSGFASLFRMLSAKKKRFQNGTLKLFSTNEDCNPLKVGISQNENFASRASSSSHFLTISRSSWKSCCSCAILQCASSVCCSCLSVLHLTLAQVRWLQADQMDSRNFKFKKIYKGKTWKRSTVYGSIISYSRSSLSIGSLLLATDTSYGGRTWSCGDGCLLVGRLFAFGGM